MVMSAGPAGEGGGQDLSPYFMVQGDPKVERFPLLETKAKVNIAGMTAEVELTQVYKNDGKKTIEAVYVFPLGTRSAIHAMRMKIADRVIDAEIEETMKAQKIYEQAKADGKVASLLEQKRPNVFQMKVANIMPGDVVEVIVRYTEILVPEAGVYEFVYPTVVGPRYTGESSASDLKGKDNWAVSPYLHEGEVAPYKFDINVHVKTGLPLAKVWVTSHKVDVSRSGRDEAAVTLSPREVNGGNRDFILKYTLQGNAIQTGLLLYPGEDENFFLLMLEPPEKVNIRMVPAREYVFILDVSGSMSGFPLDVSKALVTKIIQNLRHKDYFNILFFAGGSDVLSDRPLPATEENKKRALEMVMAQSGGGGTEILDAFKRALAMPKKKGLSRIIVTATDGYVSVEKQVFDMISENLGDANFFAFGIGTGVNRYIIEGIARVGMGEPFIATTEEEATQVASKFTSYIENPLLTDIDVQFVGFDAYDVEPLALPDLFAQRPLILYGKYRKAAGRIKISGRTPAGDYRREIDVAALLESKENSALKYLWARERIARLADYGRIGIDVKDEVTKLGLKYHLMTEYTSFVAVDKIVRKTGEIETVKQPLPLPQGVSDYAVGGVASARPSTMPQAIGLAAREVKTEVDDKRGGEKTPAQLTVTGGSVPAGVNLSDIENALLGQLKADLEKACKKFKLGKLTVKLVIEQGVVKTVTVEGLKVNAKAKSEIEAIIKRLKLNAKLTGNITLKLAYL